MQDKKVWGAILILGITFQILASAVMPIGLDGHIHATYVSDEIADGDASLDWGEVRNDGSNYSTPTEVSADDRWGFWHFLIGVWFSVLGINTFTLHLLSLTITFSCLALVFLLTKKISSNENALALTAIVSIYSPLVRATGRMYQENLILMLSAVTIYSLIMIWRKNRQIIWSILGLLCLSAAISTKGLPAYLGAILFIPVALMAHKNISLKPLNYGTICLSTFVLSVIFSYYRVGEITIEIFYFYLVTILVGGGIYLLLGGFLFSTKPAKSNQESDFVLIICQGIFAVIGAYIVMLLTVEMNSLQYSATKTAEEFTYIFRYLTVLIVPLWWSFLLKEKTEITFGSNDKKYAMSYILALIIALNLIILQTTGGVEKVGHEIADEIEDDDAILYISETSHSMHRLYTLQITTDPNHDKNVTGYWAHENYNWSHLIDDLGIDWVIISQGSHSYLDDSWIKQNSDTEYSVFKKATTV